MAQIQNGGNFSHSLVPQACVPKQSLQVYVYKFKLDLQPGSLTDQVAG